MIQSTKIKCEIYHDNMQNYKRYSIPPAQLIIADVPYNIGRNFYGSNPMWYNGGGNANGGCGSGATLRAARNLGRSAYGFEIDKTYYKMAKEQMLRIENEQISFYFM